MSQSVVASYCTSFLKAEMLHIYRQVTGLTEFETYVLAKTRQNSERYPFAEVEIIPKPHKNFLRRFYLKHIRREPPIVYRGEFQTMCAILKRRPVDLMHIYFGHTGVHLLPFIESWDRPCVVSFHGADVMLRAHQPEYADRMCRMLSLLPLVMVRSESLRDRVVGLGADPDKIRINRTGIPLDHYPFVERQVPQDGGWHFVQACRLIPKKGLVTALHAFAKFHRTHPASRFTIAGEGPMLRELRSLVTMLGLEKPVSFAGFLDQDALNALYRSGHAFVHPSELTADQNQEGIPNSMLEAMSTGLPVLSTLHGGIPEAVENGKTGILVAERDEEGLHAAMENLASDPERWKQMGRAASDAMLENFEQRAQIRKLESYYREAIAAGIPRAASGTAPGPVQYFHTHQP